MQTHDLPAVASLLGVTRRTVEAWIATGEMHAVNVSRSRESRKPRWRITADELARFVAARSTGQQPQRSPRRPRREIPRYV